MFEYLWKIETNVETISTTFKTRLCFSNYCQLISNPNIIKNFYGFDCWEMLTFLFKRLGDIEATTPKIILTTFPLRMYFPRLF